MSQMKLREGVPSTQNPRHADKTCKVFKAVKSVVYLELKRNQRGWSGVKEKKRRLRYSWRGRQKPEHARLYQNKVIGFCADGNREPWEEFEQKSDKI